jgi:hypothetical protein
VSSEGWRIQWETVPPGQKKRESEEFEFSLKGRSIVKKTQGEPMTIVQIFRSARAIVAVFAFWLVSSCGGAGSLNPFQDSPSAALKKLYMVCKAGEYSKVDELLSSDLRKAELGVGTKYFCDDVTRNGTITSIDVKSENIRGEGATVVFDIHFKNGALQSNGDGQLVKENGAWKVSK